jgi:hypothetical protein
MLVFYNALCDLAAQTALSLGVDADQICDPAHAKYKAYTDSAWEGLLDIMPLIGDPGRGVGEGLGGRG